VVDRPWLIEVDAQAPAGNLDGGHAAVVIELPDRADRSVGDVERAIALAELNAVSHREPACLDAHRLKRAAFLGVDDAGPAAPFELEAQEVSSFVDADHTRPLAGVDAAASTHES
jgi:hypothetical protein